MGQWLSAERCPLGFVEPAAIGFTVVCVVFAVKRSLWQYPTGILATVLFFWIFLEAKLYASMSLQIIFVLVQIYGWWYWLYGDAGKRPPITTWPGWVIVALAVLGRLFALLVSAALNAATDARMVFWDSAIFGLSVVAQYLLDRKKLENWIVWAAVDAISIFVYGSQGLWLTAGLYLCLLLNAGWGYLEWRKALSNSGPPLKASGFEPSRKTA